MSDDPSFELACRVVARVAAWPLSAISGLGDSTAATLARTADPQCAGWADYVTAYDDAIERTRRQLWARTVQDRRFLRALAVVNPAVADNLAGRALPARRNKRARHRETTVYRYLARAVARTEPCGLWTGATLASWGPRRHTKPAARSRFSVAPDLTPFRTIALSLRDRSPYAGRSPYTLNPTLRREEDGSYVYWTEPGHGPATQRRLSGSVSLDGIVKALEDPSSFTRAEAVAVVERVARVDSDRAMELVRTLWKGSAFVGGFAFPHAFVDPWDALEQVERALAPTDAAPWRTARLALVKIAGALQGQLDHCDAQTVVKAMAWARAVVRRLAGALHVEDMRLPRAPLRCDLVAPWEIQLGQDDAHQLQRSLAAFGRYQDTDCLHGPLLRASMRTLVGPRGTSELCAVTPSNPVAAHDRLTTWEAVAATLDDATLTGAVSRIDRALQAPGPEHAIGTAGRVAGPPLGALHLTFMPAQLGGQPYIHGLGLDPTAAYARVAFMLEGDRDAPLADWFRRSFVRLADQTGVDVVALHHDHPTPNVLAGPSLLTAGLDPWRATTGRWPTRGLRISSCADGWPVLEIPGRSRPAIAMVPTAAGVPADDPCLNALLLSSLHVPPVAAGALVHACELERPRHHPRLRIEDGSVVQARRTLLRGDVLHDLLAAKGAARFARWQRLVAEHGWPQLVQISRDGHPPLLVDRDSPLAIEAAFEGAAGCAFLRVEEFTSDAWVGAEDESDRYVAQLVLPYLRQARRRSLVRHHDAVDAVERGAGDHAGIAATG